MFHSSKIELSKSALSKNLKFLRREIGPGVTISSVVKGNAYGHGIEMFVPLAEQCGVTHFSVFDADEAYRLWQSQTRSTTDIMIMGYLDNEALEWAVESEVSFWIIGLDRLEMALTASQRVKKPARVHLELETGMNRTGLHDTELDRALDVILGHPHSFAVEGVCTHFAGAESTANYKRVQDQRAEFDRLCGLIRSRGVQPAMRHTAASAAALSYPETRMDLVRIGIAQYGFWPSKETELQYTLRGNGQHTKRYVDPLRRVLRWSSRVMHVAPVAAGEFVGYGTSYVTTRPQLIASIPVGYSDGFRRSLSNLGHVLIRGKRLSVVGLVNMSMMLVDVTSVPGVQVGDEVVIIGKQGRSRISVGSFSDMSNFVNYEMLVRLPSNIPRIVVS